MLDFNNTGIAFENKSDKELKATYQLFQLMNKSWLVGFGTQATITALKLHLPVEWAIRKTIFPQFCGGATLDECRVTVEKLARFHTKTVLDYGAEAKESEEEFEKTKQEMLKVIEFAGENPNTVPVISCKVTGLGRFDLLEKLNAKIALTETEKQEYERVRQRLDTLCRRAAELGVAVFIDAEETWIQDPVDQLAEEMMRKYNTQKVTVYNTIQLYRTDRLDFLKHSYEIAAQAGYILGAKMVRGAYMDKERSRAKEKGYPSPIQPDKTTADKDYDEAVRFCVDRRQQIASCVASHNQNSNLLQATLMQEKNIPKNDPHLTFSQLYGMSDNLTFNLAKEGYNVSKYVPYGPVRDVIPYLMRRAQENTSVSGDMSRELGFLKTEMKRRGLLR
jgi:proline dehydrogenase